jgi:hypothetical protein
MTDLLGRITLSGQVQQVDHLDPWISNVASGPSSIVVPTFLPKGMDALDPDSYKRPRRTSNAYPGRTLGTLGPEAAEGRMTAATVCRTCGSGRGRARDFVTAAVA